GERWRSRRGARVIPPVGSWGLPSFRPCPGGSAVFFCDGGPGFCRGGAEFVAVSEWLRLLPFLGVLALLGYLAVRPFLPKKKQQKDSLINLKIQKENPKVVNEINIEDLCLTKAAYCRCWRSKTFPACDGSHNKHNELTGDNVGPLILKKKEV
uniref:CDGSH iron-sulfur domain-containing protein 2 n=1 Tax=Felis catus TaxID=9685 RepID=A0ABI8A1H2_FELCA